VCSRSPGGSVREWAEYWVVRLENKQKNKCAARKH
jgi:hypothetical protein